MEPGVSMPHSQRLSNNSYPEPNQAQFPTLIPISSRSILILSSHLRLGLPKGLFLGVYLLNFLNHRYFLQSHPVYLSLLNLIHVKCNVQNLEIPH